MITAETATQAGDERDDERVIRRPPAKLSLLVAVWWLFLAALCSVMFLGGVSVVYGFLNGERRPAPTVTVTETHIEEPAASETTPGSVIEDGLSSVPTPSICIDADARGVIPRDQWTPCGQLLGYFDDATSGP
ncbi:hypothetical protein [Streptomyces sp. NPDC046332]|uniref:hypothetical protein n=1 Tax=Streptomyces sp. NPDC046332 TaxID=3155133 RepID=UPI0033CAF63B